MFVVINIRARAARGCNAAANARGKYDKERPAHRGSFILARRTTFCTNTVYILISCTTDSGSIFQILHRMIKKKKERDWGPRDLFCASGIPNNNVSDKIHSQRLFSCRVRWVLALFVDAKTIRVNYYDSSRVYRLNDTIIPLCY